MRFKEFKQRLTEAGDLADFVEDDADHAANDALINTLREIQYSSDHAAVPKISVEALINLVRQQPGAEAFNLDTLVNARKNNDTVKNIVTDIKDDDQGTKYVFINPAEPAMPGGVGGEGEVGQTAPEKTVSSMANRALSSRS
jgi:hypothetical protein